jgi:hypothetical protein
VAKPTPSSINFQTQTNNTKRKNYSNLRVTKEQLAPTGSLEKKDSGIFASMKPTI